MNFMGMGPGELVLILVIALIVLGPGKLPEIARTVGKTVREIRAISEGFQAELRKEMDSAATAAEGRKSEKASEPSAKPSEPGTPTESSGEPKTSSASPAEPQTSVVSSEESTQAAAPVGGESQNVEPQNVIETLPGEEEAVENRADLFEPAVPSPEVGQQSTTS